MLSRWIGSIFIAVLVPWPALLLATCTDLDADGYYHEADCGTPRDCNDASSTTHPTAPEACDGYDNDCDATLDEDCPSTCDGPVSFGQDRRVSDAPWSSILPSLVWTGSQFGVAWQDTRSGFDKVYFARLDADGNKLGPETTVSDAVAGESDPSLVWTGSEFGLAWERSARVRFARFDAGGNRVGVEVTVTSGPDAFEGASLVWTGSEYGVAWDRGSEIYFARLDALGNRVGAETRVTNASASRAATLAWTGAEFGVAWQDYRDGITKIYFARLDAGGNKLGVDMPVTGTDGHATGPVLAWTGSGFSVAWEDSRSYADVYLATLDPQGNKLGADILVTSEYGLTYRPSLTWTGSDLGVAWHDNRAGNDEIYFARFDAAGNKLGTDVRVTNDPEMSNSPALAWTGRGVAVAWNDLRDGITNREIYLDQWLRCCDMPDSDRDGYRSCADCDDTDSAVYPEAPQVCDTRNNDCTDPLWPVPPPWDADGDGDGFTICAGDCDDRYGSSHPGAREACDLLDNDCDGDADPCDCDADGDGSTVCGGDCNDADATQHDAAAELCDGYDGDCDGTLDDGCARSCDDPFVSAPARRITDAPGDASGISLIGVPTGYAVAWSEDRDGPREVFFARLDPRGNKLGAEVGVTSGAARAWVGALVWTGTEYGVAWEDYRDNDGEIYFARLDAVGHKLGADVRVTDEPGYSRQVDIVWTGRDYGVAWADSPPSGGTEILFTRLDAWGNRLGPVTQVTDPSASGIDPSLVWTGIEYGLAWTRLQDPYNGEIYFAKLDAHGARIGSEVRLTIAPGHSETPSLVWTGAEYGLAWSDYRSGSYEIYFTRLSAGGVKLGPDVPVSSAPEYSQGPALAWTGSEYGVAWNDMREAGSTEVYFTRLDRQGARLGPEIRVSDDPAVSWIGALVWDGEHHAFAWTDRRDGNEEIYFATVACCRDADDDGYSICGPEPDCDDSRAGVFPGAPEQCDGVNNDCNHAAWPLVSAAEADADGDGYGICAGDCDDAAPDVYPTAPELCDRRNNDCSDPAWPSVPSPESDADADGYAACEGDCDDQAPWRFPGATEVCNRTDDDCDDLVDEHAQDADLDHDGIGDICDRCPSVFDPNQRDLDGDRVGNACDNCMWIANPDQADVDTDQHGDGCDNCATTSNPLQEDLDSDLHGDACDNCPLQANASQADQDRDAEGDACDLDDGTIYLLIAEPGRIAWHDEVGFERWNFYAGDLAVLRAGGAYTQPPDGLAWRACDLAEPVVADLPVPAAGRGAFYLVTGVADGVEGGLGANSAGAARPNANPCP